MVTLDKLILIENLNSKSEVRIPMTEADVVEGSLDGRLQERLCGVECLS